MAGKEEERSVALFQLGLEGQQRLAETLPRLVLGNHHVEAELLQHLAHGTGVIDGFLQFGDVAIIVVADHEGDALLGPCRQCRECRAHQHAHGDQESLHRRIHACIPSPAIHAARLSALVGAKLRLVQS